MNVAYLDPPYSHYFERLAARFAAAEGGGQVLALLSSPAFKVYTGRDRALVWPAGRSAIRRDVLPAWRFAFWSQTLDEDCLSAFWHAVDWLHRCFVENRIDVCFVFSDARPFSMAAAVAAREAEVCCVYFERGAFRNVSSSISTQGLNARFSLQAARRSGGIDGMTQSGLRPRPTVPWLRWNFLRFILANRVARAAAPTRRLIQHKRFALMPYMRLAWVQWHSRHHFADASDVAPPADGRCIVVPLQLPEDSQLRLYSPFPDNQSFLDWVVASACEVAPGVPIFVKRPPMDTRSYRWPQGVTVVGGNLSRFFVPGAVVVCINSTVGFEAAVHGLPVVCFAPSFFTEELPLVRLVHPSQMKTQLAAALAAPHDVLAGMALRSAVMRWYQTPGDVWAFTDADLNATVSVVRQHVQAARAGRSADGGMPANPQREALMPAAD